MEGIVKWFNVRKGFGFITGDDEQDYFVHHTAIPKGIHLRENDRVSFEPADTERGKQARNISLLSGPEAAKPKKEEQYEEIQTEETEE